jgi:hypothetical protein
MEFYEEIKCDAWSDVCQCAEDCGPYAYALECDDEG